MASTRQSVRSHQATILPVLSQPATTSTGKRKGTPLQLRKPPVLLKGTASAVPQTTRLEEALPLCRGPEWSPERSRMGGTTELPSSVPCKHLNRKKQNSFSKNPSKFACQAPRPSNSMKTNQIGLHISSTQSATINSYNKKRPRPKAGASPLTPINLLERRF